MWRRSKVPGCRRDRLSRANAIRPYCVERRKSRARRGLKCKAATIATLRTSQPHSTEIRILITISRTRKRRELARVPLFGGRELVVTFLPHLIRVSRSASFLGFQLTLQAGGWFSGGIGPERAFRSSHQSASVPAIANACRFERRSRLSWDAPSGFLGNTNGRGRLYHEATPNHAVRPGLGGWRASSARLAAR
jgi:hypothetical protein